MRARAALGGHDTRSAGKDTERLCQISFGLAIYGVSRVNSCLYCSSVHAEATERNAAMRRSIICMCHSRATFAPHKPSTCPTGCTAHSRGCAFEQQPSDTYEKVFLVMMA